MLKRRLKNLYTEKPSYIDYIKSTKQVPIATDTALANEQHYEIPPSFFEIILGPRLKYSSCYWSKGATDLAMAEDEILRLTCERAQIQDQWFV